MYNDIPKRDNSHTTKNNKMCIKQLNIYLSCIFISNKSTNNQHVHFKIISYFTISPIYCPIVCILTLYN